MENNNDFSTYFIEYAHNMHIKVAQLVRCRTSNQLLAGSIAGWGTLVCSWARQFIPNCLSLPSKMGT